MPESPPTSVELGLMRGFPPPPERLVTSDNWIEGPFNRWGFTQVVELPYDLRDLGSVPVAFEGIATPFADSLAQTYSDGVCVIHAGNVVFEHYVDGMDPSDTHLLMSVSKSLTATLVGVLVG